MASAAKSGAWERTVGLHGATAAQQALAAGLLDEIQLHLVPVLLGGGVRLFDLLGADAVELVATGSSRQAAV
jgi:riboflavin biosynthesis pyrimidine reductase